MSWELAWLPPPLGMPPQKWAYGRRRGPDGLRRPEGGRPNCRRGRGQWQSGLASGSRNGAASATWRDVVTLIS